MMLYCKNIKLNKYSYDFKKHLFKLPFTVGKKYRIEIDLSFIQDKKYMKFLISDDELDNIYPKLYDFFETLNETRRIDLDTLYLDNVT